VNEKGSKKKYVIIAVVITVVIALVLTAILVGMYLFTESEKNLVQETMQLTSNTNQQMTVDPTANIIEYHVTSPDVDAMIVEDYNNFIEVVKLTTASGVYCYANPLNETSKVDLTQINKPASINTTNAPTLYYLSANIPIPDVSFLNQKAQDLCKGISVYWAYPVCYDGKSDTNTQPAGRQTRGACQWVCNWVCSHWWSCHFSCFWADVACYVIGSLLK
jgi:hypothetical protein